MEINDFIFNAELEEILDELRHQLQLNNIQLLQKTPKKSGNSLQIQCPYHGNGLEKKPSAGIRRSDGMFHCFACGEVHTLQEVISHCFGHDEDLIGSWGWKWLVKNFATVRVEERKDIVLDLEREPKKKPEPEYVSEKELEQYRWVHKYMYARKLNDEVIDMFDIGYDAKTKCITFPVRDLTGGCLFIARRSVKTKFFNYPEGVEKPLYGIYELYKVARKEFHCIDTHIIYDFPDEIIVCESMLDALTCWVYGKYAVALNGLGNDLSITQLKELPCRKLILATDKDDAGKNARIKLREKINNKIITEFDYNTYPEHAKDINDMTKEEFYSLGEIF